MPKPLPKLSLSHGQVAWALSLGASPTQTLLDQLRYLRELGIPFEESELGRGRGNRLRYSYDELIEVGVAVFALRRGVAPRDIAQILGGRRGFLRRHCRKIYLEQPDEALNDTWVKSRGREIPVWGSEPFLRLHDRHSDQPGKLDLLLDIKASDLSQVLGFHELYPGEMARTLVPLRRLVLELVAWALEAPETRPGPQ